MIPYILHASILLGASFFFYWLLLRKETFYKLNRTILLTALIVSMALPLITVPSYLSIHSPVAEELQLVKNPDLAVTNSVSPSARISESPIPPPPPETKSTKVLAEALPPATPITSDKEVISPVVNDAVDAPLVSEGLKAKLATWNLSKIIWTVYLVGVGIFLLTFLIQLFILLIKKSKLEYIQDGKYRIYELNEDAAPFSFFTWIFINPASYDFDTYNQIIEHEKIHVKQAHYVDKFISELGVVIMWFNPFMWMHRNAIANNLEFLTDEEMLGIGTEKESYQMSLLKVSVPDHALSIATSYNESFLSERIRMMNAKKSSAKSSWKYLLIFPLLALSLATLNAVKSDSDLAISEFEMMQNDEKSSTSMANKESVTTTTVRVNTENESKVEASNQLVQLDDENSSEAIEEINTVTVATETKSTSAPIAVDVSGIINQALSSAFKDQDFINSQTIISQGSESISTIIESTVEKELENVFENVFSNSDKSKVKPGMWQGVVDGDEICVFLNNSNNDSYGNWTCNECFKINEIKNFSSSGEVAMSIIRDPGTLLLKGGFNNSVGVGTFQFDPSESFNSYLNGLNINGVKKSDLFQMFLNNTSKSSISGLQRNGLKLSKDNLIKAGIFKITPEKIAEFQRIEKMLGEKFSLEDMIELSIHKVDEDYVKSLMNLKLEGLTKQTVLECKIHGVTPEYMNSLKSLGMKNMSARRVVEFAIHNVDIGDAQLYKSVFKDLSLQEILELKIHNADTAELELWKQYGFALTAREFKEFSIHNVSTDLYKEFKEYGYKNIGPKDLIEAKIHNMRPSQIGEFEDMGFSNISFNELKEFKIHNIDSRYVKSLRDLGLEFNKSQIVEAKIHGVRTSYVKDIQALNLTGVDLNQLVKAKIHGVNANFIKQVRSQGYSPSSLNEYVQLKIKGI